jgi:hypothetical protein
MWPLFHVDAFDLHSNLPPKTPHVCGFCWPAAAGTVRPRAGEAAFGEAPRWFHRKVLETASIGTQVCRQGAQQYRRKLRRAFCKWCC